MLVVNHYILDRLERDVNDVFDVIEALVGSLLASCLLEVETQVLNGPLRAVLIVVLIGLLLDSDIGEMHLHVVVVVCRVRVLGVAESGKALRTKPHFHWPVACNKDIDAEVKLFATD